MPPDTMQVQSYYRAALAALAFLERTRPTGRRFGADADARWSAVRGGLSAGDRIDLLVRDVSAEFPASLGARAAFDFGSVAEDDAFGRDWPGLDGVTAERLYREVAGSAASDVASTLAAMAGAWSVTLAPVEVPGVDARARFVVAGASAIAALATAFARSPDARWSDQVVVVADAPVARQLAAVVPALLNQPGSTALGRSSEAVPASFGNAHVVVSPDASADESGRARSLRA
jgi:hypothetical protein